MIIKFFEEVTVVGSGGQALYKYWRSVDQKSAERTVAVHKIVSGTRETIAAAMLCNGGDYECR